MAPAPIYNTQRDQVPQLLDRTSLKDGGPMVSGTYDCKEDYNGDYRFAPIEEAQVSRAMIKRSVPPPYPPLPPSSSGTDASFRPAGTST